MKIKSTRPLYKSLSKVAHEKKTTLQVLKMINQGLSYRRIAEQLKLSISTVYNLYWKEIQRTDEDIKQHIDLIRAKQLKEVYAMQDVATQQWTQGDLKAMDSMMHLQEREAKLLSIYPDEKPQEQRIIVIGFPQPGVQHVSTLEDGNTIQGTATEIPNQDTGTP